ncbi:hypothetical protein Agub_g9962, partial [Astrephomene gubernaculifera]
PPPSPKPPSPKPPLRPKPPSPPPPSPPPPAPVGLLAVGSFCPYPKKDISASANIKCYSPGACPLGNRTTRAHIQAAAEACLATPKCLAFTSDGWLKSAGSEAMQPTSTYYTTPVQGTYVLRPK